MATIFDMDGVVADTQRFHALAESEMLATLGLHIEPDEISRRFAGVSNKDMFATLFAEVGRPSPYSTEISDRIFERFCSFAHLFTGIKGTVVRINELYGRMPLGLASATRPAGIELVLTSVGVREKISAIASSREVAKGKPAPDVFLLAARRLGVEPRDCTVVEDGVSGMLGARAAGMRCVALVTDRSREYPADLVVTDLRQVPLEWFR